MPNRPLPIAGKIFGAATPIYPIKKNHSRYWVCVCDCGNTFHASSHALSIGQTKGCPKCARKKYKGSFWDYVAVGAPNECWPWLGYIGHHGYGVIPINRKPFGAHRMAYEKTFGHGQGDRCVCHKCDNRKCCNPNHLYLGTHNDNMRDMALRGRAVTRFTGHKHAKLVGDKFLEFARRIRSGEKPTHIAKEYGICDATACKIARKLFAQEKDDV